MPALPMSQRIARGGAGLLLAMALGGCAGFFGSRTVPPQPQSGAPAVEMISGGLLVSRSGTAELALTLINRSQRTLWVTVYFQTPGGLKDCLLARELGAAEKHLFVCPQDTVRPDTDYPVQITVFTDLAQTQVLDRIGTRLRFEAGDVQRLR